METNFDSKIAVNSDYVMKTKLSQSYEVIV